MSAITVVNTANNLAVKQVDNKLYVQQTSNTISVKLVSAQQVTTGWQRDKFTGDGVTVQFTTTKTFAANSLMVFVNGILQESDIDYTEAGDNTYFTMSSAVKANWKVEAVYVEAV